MPPDADARTLDAGERREHPDRRRRLLHALVIGSISQRRREHRRHARAHPHPLDHHQARWLAIAILILLMSVADAPGSVAVLNMLNGRVSVLSIPNPTEGTYRL